MTSKGLDPLQQATFRARDRAAAQAAIDAAGIGYTIPPEPAAVPQREVVRRLHARDPRALHADVAAVCDCAQQDHYGDDDTWPDPESADPEL